MITGKLDFNKLQSKIEDVNLDIDKFQTKLSEVPKDMKPEYEKAIKALEDKTQAFETRINKLKKSGEYAVDDMKSGVSMAWDDLHLAYQSAKSHFARYS